MHGARLAAASIEAAVTTGGFGRDAFRGYEDEVLAGSAIWDDFIRLFYRLLPAFTHLLESKEHRPAMLRMIQGDLVPDSEPEVLAQMRALVRTVEEADHHPWRPELVTIL